MSQETQPQVSIGAPVAFFAVTFALALPFYILNALAFLDFVGGPGMGPIYIALFTLSPVASAAMLTFRQRRTGNLKRLLRRTFDFKRIGDHRWYGAIVLIPLLISLLSLAGSVLSGAPLPRALAPVAALPVVLLFFFLLAAGEETGWMGYAFEPMQARYGALQAALLLGVVWAIWHVPFFVFMMPEVVVFQLVTLVSTRVLIAWVYNNAGKSVFAAIVFHTVGNVLLVTLPDTRTDGVLGPAISCGLAVSAAVMVTYMWGSQTLACYRFTH